MLAPRPPRMLATALLSALLLAPGLSLAQAPPVEEQARQLASALETLIVEYGEYTRDGQVVDERGYQEVLDTYLPRVHAAWAPVREAIAAKDAGLAERIGGDVDRLDERVRAVAPVSEVEAVALGVRGDVQAALGLGPSARGPDDALAALRETEAVVDRGVAAYAAGDRDGALALLQAAYLDVYAPRAEASVPRDLNARIEQLLNVDLKDAVRRGAPLADVRATQAELHAAFEAAALAMAPRGDAGLFANAFLIIAREGFEAALVLAAVIGYLVRSGHRDRARQVYLGAALAALATLALYAAVSTVFSLSGASREVLEGATALLAVVVLFYVSFWLIDKVHIKRWNRFIQGKVRSALTGTRHTALVSIAFLAVFREGLETVLFYQALLAGATGPASGLTALAGFVAGFAVLAAVFLAFTRYGVHIPMRRFFVLTSALLYYLALTLAGKGVHELQEAGVVATTALPGVARALGASPGLAWLAGALGFSPTLETLAAQAVLLAAAAGGLAWSFVVVPRRERAAELAGPERAAEAR
jgi:high-affinity iron transporter